MYCNTIYITITTFQFYFFQLSRLTSYSFHSQESLGEMRSRDSSWVAESDAAASEATKGALSGAAKVPSTAPSVTPLIKVSMYRAGNGATGPAK